MNTLIILTSIFIATLCAIKVILGIINRNFIIFYKIEENCASLGINITDKNVPFSYFKYIKRWEIEDNSQEEMRYKNISLSL